MPALGAGESNGDGTNAAEPVEGHGFSRAEKAPTSTKAPMRRNYGQPRRSAII
jgi:hypothetical protein